MKYFHYLIFCFSIFFSQIGYNQVLKPETDLLKNEKNQTEFGRSEKFTVLYIVDSIHFYSEEEFKHLDLKNFVIEKKYYNNKSEIVNLIVFIRTKDND